MSTSSAERSPALALSSSRRELSVSSRTPDGGAARTGSLIGSAQRSKSAESTGIAGCASDRLSTFSERMTDVPRGVRLTRRERDLIAEIMSGQSNKAIARNLGIKEQTVRNHLSVLFHKLGVSSRLELAVKFGSRPRGSE